MVYVPTEDSADGIAKVVYTSKDRKSRKVFNALDWLTRLMTHIPVRYEQAVRYYGWYSIYLSVSVSPVRIPYPNSGLW